MEFEKYMHLERYGNAEVEDIEVGVVYAFPKLDGTNGQLWWDEDNGLMAGSRNRTLYLDNDNAGFYAYALSQEKFTRFFKYAPTTRLIGEWLVPHSLKTYRDDAWRKFYVFDVQTADGHYLPYEHYKPWLDMCGIDYLAPLAILKNPSYDQIQHTLNKNVFLIKDGEGIGEGIVLKNYNFVNKFGRVCWAKVISNAFKEVHHKEMGAPIINGDLIEEKVVDKYVTSHLVEKVYAKIEVENGGWTSKYIPQLLNTVWYDLIREEMWDILKHFNNPRIDFKLLKSLTIAKIKELKTEVF